jgi:hypothetical protein
MSDKPGLLARVKAKIRALHPENWQGEAGQRFRSTIDNISEYSKKSVRIRERLEEAPDVAWNSIKVKSSEALVNAAEEEQTRIASELARRTLTDKARQESATADRLETEARTAKIQEMEARLRLVESLRKANCVPVWDAHGKMTVLKAPPDYDWDGLNSNLLQATELPLPEDRSVSSLNASTHGRANVTAQADAIFAGSEGEVIILESKAPLERDAPPPTDVQTPSNDEA